MRPVPLDIGANVAILLQVCPDLVDHVHVVHVFVLFNQLLVEWIDVVGLRDYPVLTGVPIEILQLVDDSSLLIPVSIKSLI